MQLAQEVAGELTPQGYIWERDGKFFDALRPAVSPRVLTLQKKFDVIVSFISPESKSF